MNERPKFMLRLMSAALIAAMLASCGGTAASSSKAASSKSGSAASSSAAASDGSASGGESAAASSRAELSPELAAIAHYQDPKQTAEGNYKKYGHYGNTPTDYCVLNGERDAWTWPYARDSIWNTPIGSDAEYSPAGFTKSAMYMIDDEYLFTTDSSDPVLEIYNTGMGNRWPADYKQTLKKVSYTTYWPKGVTIESTAKGNTCSAILQPDGRSIIQLQPTCREYPDADHVNGWDHGAVTDIYGDGRLGTHWGSGLSTLGGSIRLGELTSDKPIRHALKFDIYAAWWIYYSVDLPGYKWPADRADGYANEEGHALKYAGKNPLIVQGSLFALDPSLTAESLGLKTEVGKKLFFALQNYGCYLVDDSACDAFNLCAEIGVDAEVKNKYGFSLNGHANSLYSSLDVRYYKDLMALMTNLSVVTNNSEKSVGGGGTPRQPLAPDLKSVK
mgnify:CR=1 FL=1